MTQEEAQVALDKVLVEISVDLPAQVDETRLWKGCISVVAPDGQPYAAVASEYWSENQEAMGRTTPVEAIAIWKDRMIEYATAYKGHGNLLWWHTRPQISKWVPPGGEHPIWMAYSRLKIGNAADAIPTDTSVT